MTHQRIRQWLLLYLYDELPARRRKKLEGHLETCSDCRSELGELREFHRIADQGFQPPSQQLLHEARLQLKQALAEKGATAERARSLWAEALFGRGRWISFAPVRAALLAGAACLLSGIGLGIWVAGKLSPESGSLAFGDQNLRIENVEFIDADADGGEVEISFDAVRPVRLKGDFNDPTIRTAISQTLLSGRNPGQRMRAVGILEGETGKSLDQDVKQTLIRAVKYDENSGVRKRALNVLSQSVLDNEVKEALLHVVVRDENPGMRVAAISALEAVAGQGARVDPRLLAMLKERLETEENDYVRLRGKAFLEEVRFQ